HLLVAAGLPVGRQLGQERAPRSPVLGAELVDHAERGSYVAVLPQAGVDQLPQHGVLDQIEPLQRRARVPARPRRRRVVCERHARGVRPRRQQRVAAGAKSIPKNTPVPIECRLAAPAPLDVSNGATPSMKANDVIRIGRSRSRPASRAASLMERPWARSSFANSTIRIAFLAARPTTTI